MNEPAPNPVRPPPTPRRPARPSRPSPMSMESNTTTITLNDLTVGCDPVEINRALRADLTSRDPQAIATTEINGGEIATIVDDQNTPQTVAQVLVEIDAFLTDEDEL